MNSTSTSTMASDIVTMVTGARGQTTTMTEMSPEPVSARARVARAALATTPPGVMPSTVPVPGIPTQVTVVQQCPPPPPVAGGTLMSSGPYIANVSTAVYSCLSGFYMSGSASISCAGTSSWSGAPPSCFPNRYWRNEYNIGQGYGIPLWLAILLGILAAIVALLLLSCCLMLCLRLCGCLEGPICGPWGETSGNSAGFMCCRQRRRKIHRRRTRRNSVYSESSLPSVEDVRRTGSMNRNTGVLMMNRGRVPEHNRNLSQLHVSQPPLSTVMYPVPGGSDRHTRDWGTSPDEGYATPGMVTVTRDVIQKEKKRRTAKQPLPGMSKWMPHSNPLRNINTSTK